jgi:hypothetical protein
LTGVFGSELQKLSPNLKAEVKESLKFDVMLRKNVTLEA